MAAVLPGAGAKHRTDSPRQSTGCSIFVIVMIPNGQFCGPEPAGVKVSDTWKVRLSVQGRHLSVPRDAAEHFSRFGGANVQSKAGYKCEQTA